MNKNWRLSVDEDGGKETYHEFSSNDPLVVASKTTAFFQLAFDSEDYDEGYDFIRTLNNYGEHVSGKLKKVCDKGTDPIKEKELKDIYAAWIELLETINGKHKKT